MVGRSVVIFLCLIVSFFFNSNAHIVAVVLLQHRKFCIYKGNNGLPLQTLNIQFSIICVRSPVFFLLCFLNMFWKVYICVVERVGRGTVNTPIFFHLTRGISLIYYNYSLPEFGTDHN